MRVRNKKYFYNNFFSTREENVMKGKKYSYLFKFALRSQESVFNRVYPNHLGEFPHLPLMHRLADRGVG